MNADFKSAKTQTGGIFCHFDTIQTWKWRINPNFEDNLLGAFGTEVPSFLLLPRRRVTCLLHFSSSSCPISGGATSVRVSTKMRLPSSPGGLGLYLAWHWLSSLKVNWEPLLFAHWPRLPQSLHYLEHFYDVYLSFITGRCNISRVRNPSCISDKQKKTIIKYCLIRSKQ